jgi:hypothetical protein
MGIAIGIARGGVLILVCYVEGDPCGLGVDFADWILYAAIHTFFATTASMSKPTHLAPQRRHIKGSAMFGPRSP